MAGFAFVEMPFSPFPPFLGSWVLTSPQTLTNDYKPKPILTEGRQVFLCGSTVVHLIQAQTTDLRGRPACVSLLAACRCAITQLAKGPLILTVAIGLD